MAKYPTSYGPDPEDMMGSGSASSSLKKAGKQIYNARAGGRSKPASASQNSDYLSNQNAEDLLTPMGATRYGYRMGRAAGGMSDSASAANKGSPGPGGAAGPMTGLKGKSPGPKGAAGPMSALGSSSGSITKPSKAYQAAKKAQGDAYLSQSATDYGMGSAVNDFVNKPKKK